jgi:hypothetical protein
MTEAEENLYAIYRSITDDERDDQDIAMEIVFRDVSVDTLRKAKGYIIDAHEEVRRIAEEHGFDAHDSDTLEDLETLIDSIDLLLHVNDEV